MKKTFVVIILVLLTFSLSYSQVMNKTFELKNDSEVNRKYQKMQELQNKIIFDNSRITGRDTLLNEPEEKANPKSKSVLLGTVLSGLIPGAGEFYAKSYIKSAAFFAAEVGLWVTYAIFEKKGDNQTDLFQNYANGHWDMRKYAQWLKDQGFTKASDINLSSSDDILRGQINACEEINFSHTLPPPGEQQYYEVIGKYQNFITGWSSANPSVITKNNYLDYHLPEVTQYMADRQQANNYYNTGSTMLTVVIINHLLSAADGAWSVTRYNNKLDVKSNINVQGEYSYILQRTVIVPHLNVSVTF